MTDTTTPPVMNAAGSEPGAAAPGPGRPRGGGRGRQLRWVLPLGLACVAFVAFALPPYLTFDPSRSRLPAFREGFPLYYPLLVTHIIFGSVALLAGCMQVWPWFRRRHPVAHRMIGRVYVFGGCCPQASPCSRSHR